MNRVCEEFAIHYGIVNTLNFSHGLYEIHRTTPMLESSIIYIKLTYSEDLYGFCSDGIAKLLRVNYISRLCSKKINLNYFLRSLNVE